MADQPNELRSLDWNNIASQSWYPPGIQGPVWLSAFLIMRPDHSQLSPDPVIMDFGDARVIAFYGQLPYMRIVTSEIRSTELPEFHSIGEVVTSPEGAYLLIVLPFDDTQPSVSEPRTRVRISQLLGLMTSVFGPNAVYHRLFDNVVRPQVNQRTAFSESFRTPTSMPDPDFSPQKIQLAMDAHNAIAARSRAQANRVWLSLQWFSDAQFSRGVDIFLKLWFALESLGMSDRNNIRPIVVSLARAYGISPRQAKRRFFVGQLFGFRSRIVHQGEIQPIHSLLSDFLGAMFLDVLYENLGLPPQAFAESIQNDPAFDSDEFIR